MLTRSAARAAQVDAEGGDSVLSRAELATLGWASDAIRRQVQAGRWRMLGRAVVLHNGPLAPDERWRAALVNCGPRCVLASFTALEALGLTGWTRPEIHLLAPAGVAAPCIDLAVVLHRSASWAPHRHYAARRCERPAPAAVLAAAAFGTARPACGLMAATVQQRLVRPDELRAAIVAAPRTRHHRALLAAADDIAMGAQALSEIDFVRLCRRHGLPAPTLQAVRTEPSGRRRYLDAEWRLSDGRVVAVEVDGAVHIAPRRWFDDQLRQNELSLAGTMLLRYPSVVVREEEALVVGQLGRALSSRS